MLFVIMMCELLRTCKSKQTAWMIGLTVIFVILLISCISYFRVYDYWMNLYYSFQDMMLSAQ